MKNKGKFLVSVCMVLLCLLLLPGISPSATSSGAKSTEELQTGETEDGTESQLFTPDLEKGQIFTQNGEQFTVFPASISVDLNRDGKCTAADAREMLRISAHLSAYDGDVSAVDVSRDGKLTVADARLLLRYTARLDVYYSDGAGQIVLTGFADDPDGRTFYFTDYGCMTSGYQIIDGTAYYIRRDTGLYKGTMRIGNVLYFFDEEGKGVNGAQTVEEKNYFFENGKAYTGWRQDGEDFYYYQEDGSMAVGKVVIDGLTCMFDEEGKGVNGAQTVDGKTYFFENGKAHTGWRQVGNDYYYYNQDGSMAIGEMIIDGLLYTFGADGKSATGNKGTVPRDPSTYKIAMIGDSLVASIGAYNVTDRIDFYGKVSLHANTIFTKKISGSSRYLIDEVKDRGYDVVIILVGINDLGYADGAWGEQYRAIIQGVKARAPQATVYAHAILPVNESVARKNGYSCTNAQVNAKNAVIKRIASEEGVRYIDAGTIFRTSAGDLPAGAASDGIHLTRTYCVKWSDWLIDTVCKP